MGKRVVVRTQAHPPECTPEESKHILTYGDGSKPHEFTWSNGLWCGGDQKMFGSMPRSMATLGWRYIGPVDNAH